MGDVVGKPVLDFIMEAHTMVIGNDIYLMVPIEVHEARYFESFSDDVFRVSVDRIETI